METRLLKMFCAVAEGGGLGAAAAVAFAAVATGQRSRRVLQAGGWPVYDSLRGALRALGELERG